MKSEDEIRELRDAAEQEMDDAAMAGKAEQARYWLGEKNAYDEVLNQ